MRVIEIDNNMMDQGLPKCFAVDPSTPKLENEVRKHESKTK
jgi:hypothetical protein